MKTATIHIYENEFIHIFYRGKMIQWFKPSSVLSVTEKIETVKQWCLNNGFTNTKIISL